MLCSKSSGWLIFNLIKFKIFLLNIFQHERRSRFLVMGMKPQKPRSGLSLTFMVPWTKSKVSFLFQKKKSPETNVYQVPRLQQIVNIGSLLFPPLKILNFKDMIAITSKVSLSASRTEVEN